MPSFSNPISEIQQTSNVPVGGKLFSLVSGANYVVPAGMTLVITQIVQTATPIGASGSGNRLHGSIFYINQSPVAVFNPSEQFIYYGSLSNSLRSIHPQTLSLNLIFSENESLSFSGVTKTNNSEPSITSLPTGYLSGYLIKNVGQGKKETDFLEVEKGLWAPNILSLVKSRSTETPANVVFLGDDTSGAVATHRFALILPNNILDKNAYVLNIETNAQTSVYTGTEKFSFNGFGGLMACWDSNYNGSGKTKLRVIAHPHNGHSNLISNNILLISVTKDASSVVEDDFKVENLGTKIPRLNSIMSLAAADGTYNAVLGFAGSDHVVVVRPSLTANQAKLASYNISGVLTTETAVTSTTFTLSNKIESRVVYQGYSNSIFQFTPMAQATAVRGIQGKLYVSCPHTSTIASITGNFVAVFNKNGTIASQTLNTYTSSLTVPVGSAAATGFYNLNASKPTLGLSSAASGAERLTFYLSGVNDSFNDSSQIGYSYRNPVIGNYSFSSAAAPTLTQTPPTASTATSNYSFQTNFSSTATIVAPSNLIFNSWWASRTLTPFYKYLPSGSYGIANSVQLAVEDFYNQPDLWHNSVNQWLRTTGILTGTVNHFYVPDGIFVQRRTLTNLGSLSASPVLNTAILNPVAAYCSANYVLVVGVDGSWERISEV